MKIAITQRQLTVRSITYDCLEQGWFRFLQGHELIPIPNIPNIDVDADMIVFTGGDTSDDREQVERMLFEYAIKNNLPMLGVCHGAFFLNRMYNGNNQSILGHQNTDHYIKIGKDMINKHEVNQVVMSSYPHVDLSKFDLKLLEHHWEIK
jgi:hypothetical protein